MQLLNGRLVLSPSDLNDYVECPHLTGLSLEVARGARPRPHLPSEQNELLRRKGQEHEAAYLARLSHEGREVVEIVTPDPWDFEAGALATVEAMRAGAVPTAPAWRQRAGLGLTSWGRGPAAGERGRRAFMLPTLWLVCTAKVRCRRMVQACISLTVSCPGYRLPLSSTTEVWSCHRQYLMHSVQHLEEAIAASTVSGEKGDESCDVP
jgi:hypothetical protein